MGKLFPSIPLVAEEDSAFVRENNLVDAVVEVVTDKSSIADEELSQDNVLQAIDRGGKDAFLFGPQPATYWVSFITVHFKLSFSTLYLVFIEDQDSDKDLLLLSLHMLAIGVNVFILKASCGKFIG